MLRHAYIVNGAGLTWAITILNSASVIHVLDKLRASQQMLIQMILLFRAVYLRFRLLDFATVLHESEYRASLA